jgi:Ca2+-binding EF-hand superfamily protein
MAKEITLAELRTMAKQAGLKLSDEELEKLVLGGQSLPQAIVRAP